MKMVLYRIENRELTDPKWIDVPDGTVDLDAWLFDNGKGGGKYTLRRGIVQTETLTEIASLHRAHDRLKAEGKLPSVAGRVVGKLAERNT